MKNLYFSIFLLFFRLSRWEGNLKARTASMAVSTLLGIAMVDFHKFLEIASRRKIEPNYWLFGGILLVIVLVSDHILIDKGRGLEFVNTVQSFSKKRQRNLYAVAAVVVILIFASFYATLFLY